MWSVNFANTFVWIHLSIMLTFRDMLCWSIPCVNIHPFTFLVQARFFATSHVVDGLNHWDPLGQMAPNQQKTMTRYDTHAGGPMWHMTRYDTVWHAAIFWVPFWNWYKSNPFPAKRYQYSGCHTCHIRVIRVIYVSYVSYTCHIRVIYVSYTCHIRVIYVSYTCHTCHYYWTYMW